MNNVEAMAAIDKRVSMRAYTDKPLEQEKLDQLQVVVDEANADGMSFQLYGPREGMGTALDLNRGMFASSSRNYAALVAGKDDLSSEKLGYYGEKLALLATHLGLGTCWVASTYDHDTIRAEVGPDQVLWDVMPIGYAPEKIPLKQRTIRAAIRKTDKKPQAMIKSDVPFDQLPEWITAGIDAVAKGPSAVNKQPVVFSYFEGKLTAAMPGQTYAIRFNDFGIAKLHFQIGVESCGVMGTWEWGEGGAFVRA